ncbi:MAG TPA: ABC transporter substrate-binding protein, partial [Methanomicrobiales archaeon]|nr:ABC transporter substrate-binding protein [Methanomicrobiales archaeon]
MMKKILVGVAVVLVALGIVYAYGAITAPPVGAGGPETVGILYAKGVGPLPMLLATNQVDGYIAWQPFVEIAPLSGIGKVVTYSGDLPPDDTWKNHPQNVFVARDDFAAANPGIVTALTALTVVSDRYITDHPSEAARITADWLAGGGNFTYGNVSVSSVVTMERAIPTIIYTTDPSPEWISGTKKFITAQADLGYVTGILKNSSPGQQDAILFNFGPYQEATRELGANQIATPRAVTTPIGFGYLLAADHAALFVA